jgi:hypothetical protein
LNPQERVLILGCSLTQILRGLNRTNPSIDSREIIMLAKEQVPAEYDKKVRVKQMLRRRTD